MRVLIIGYGEMGHAMQALLKERHELLFYDAVPRDNLKPVDFEAEAEKAECILLCVPAEPHQQLLERLAPCLQQKTVCMSIAKGLDNSGRTPAQIYADVFGVDHPYALMYGPMISEEILSNRDGFADLWCSDPTAREKLHSLFYGSKLSIRDTDDIIGISWAVILKNIYAMAFGVADELELGVNVRGYLAVTAIHELSAIVRDMGGDPATPFHLAGLGDLITTATSEDSHHHGVGRKLARGESEGIDGEGPHTLRMVEKFGLLELDRYPLLSLISGIVKKPGETKKLFSCFLDHV